MVKYEIIVGYNNLIGKDPVFNIKKEIIDTESDRAYEGCKNMEDVKEIFQQRLNLVFQNASFFFPLNHYIRDIRINVNALEEKVKF